MHTYIHKHLYIKIPTQLAVAGRVCRVGGRSACIDAAGRAAVGSRAAEVASRASEHRLQADSGGWRDPPPPRMTPGPGEEGRGGGVWEDWGGVTLVEGDMRGRSYIDQKRVMRRTISRRKIGQTRRRQKQIKPGPYLTQTRTERVQTQTQNKAVDQTNPDRILIWTKTQTKTRARSLPCGLNVIG